ncbi:hypothetical protein [Lentzea kentuckyensis]|uniref:hypothetical protein n=1 Tax=Lentzea kentuckyensis TaxID=360086 RepID=UPI000A3A6268|nr:hypothetical protein [Lentzea kentuckyensis]
MATSDEIRERIEQADAARNIRRLAAAQRVGELANRRRKLTTEVDEIDAELGAVVAENVDVISPQELAAFTDVPACDLTDWLNRRKTARTKRKRTARTDPDTKSETPQAQALMPPVTAEPHGALPRIPEPVT